MSVDLDAIAQALTAPHVIELHAARWTILHPLSCRPNLLDCEVNRAAEDQIREPLAGAGRFEVELDCEGTLLIGLPVQGDLRDPIDVPAMAAEILMLRADLESHHRYIAGLTGGSCRLCGTRGGPD